MFQKISFHFDSDFNIYSEMFSKTFSIQPTVKAKRILQNLPWRYFEQVSSMTHSQISKLSQDGNFLLYFIR